MAGNVDDIDKLIRLEEIDKALEESIQTLEESPVQKKIEAIRSKKSEFKIKRDQIDQIYIKARNEINQVSAKDSELAKGQEKVQKEIEETKGDYRKVEAHTNKLNELTNQRKIVDEKLEKIEANFNKIKEMKEKVDSNIEKLSMQEDDLNKELENSTVNLKLSIDAGQKEKENLEKQISADALAAYKKSRNYVGKLVIAKLQNNSCSVCRSQLSNAQMSKVLDNAPISVCPNCSRILIKS